MATDLPHWHVEGAQVHEETSLGTGNSGLVQQWIVPYTIDDGPAKGTTQQVTVAPRDFTQAGVKAAIEEHLNNVHLVAGLKSDHA
jgi:hypothetical protein